MFPSREELDLLRDITKTSKTKEEEQEEDDMTGQRQLDDLWGRLEVLLNKRRGRTPDEISQFIMSLTECTPDPEPIEEITKYARTVYGKDSKHARSFNPMLEYWMETVYAGDYGYMQRSRCVETFSWAIPCSPLLLRMLELSGGKILEIAAGTGYWARLLSAVGCDVIATDNYSENRYNIGRFYDVKKMDEKEAVATFDPAYALFMCWPRNCEGVKQYQGDTIMFIGETDGGCTYDILHYLYYEGGKKRGWVIEETRDIPCWRGIHDRFICLKRKSKRTKVKE